MNSNKKSIQSNNKHSTLKTKDYKMLWDNVIRKECRKKVNNWTITTTSRNKYKDWEEGDCQFHKANNQWTWITCLEHLAFSNKCKWVLHLSPQIKCNVLLHLQVCSLNNNNNKECHQRVSNWVPYRTFLKSLKWKKKTYSNILQLFNTNQTFNW